MTKTAVGDQVAGDDWTWLWRSDSDVSTWDLASLLITIRTSDSQSGDLVASSGVDGKIVTTGSDDFSLPASSFDVSGSVLSGYMLGADTAKTDPGSQPSRTLWFQVQVRVNGRLRTVMPAVSFQVTSRL